MTEVVLQTIERPQLCYEKCMLPGVSYYGAI